MNDSYNVVVKMNQNVDNNYFHTVKCSIMLNGQCG